MSDYVNALPVGIELDGKYVIEAVLGSGGFGIVYRARHRHLATLFAIKEYLPTEVAARDATTVRPLSSQSRGDYEDGLGRFLREARQLVQFEGHPNIVRCLDYFEGNGTAYLVMAFEEGLSLAELLEARESAGRPMDEAEVVDLLRPLLEGLSQVHAKGVLHRDIKPGNIFIRRRDEQPVLLDFGAAKEDFSRHSKSRAPHSPGYAAPEQVEDEGRLGPWTDLYAIGAVLWRIVTGEVPAKVESRMTAVLRGRRDPLVLDERTGGGRFGAGLLQLMSHCLELDEERRVQSAEALLGLLLADSGHSGTSPCGPADHSKGGDMSAKELEYVGFWPRVGAAIVDSFLIMLVTLPAVHLYYGSSYWLDDRLVVGPMDFIINFVFPLIAVIWFWLAMQATPGKLLIGARVVDARSGSPLSIGQCLMRYFGYIVSALPLLFGYIWVAVDRRGQGWHDKLAGSVVVRVKNRELERVPFEAP